MSEYENISLPRTLVNQLLHTAQSMPASIRWGVITGSNGYPENCHALGIACPSKVDLQTLRVKLHKNDELIWALFSSSPGEVKTPNESELGNLQVPRFVGISLGTKGVLQLRGWQIEGGVLHEQPVTIIED